MLTDCRSPMAAELLRRLDDAVDVDCLKSRCDRVKEILEEIFHSDHEWIEPEYLVPSHEKYARRLMHRDPEGRYTVVAMVWDVGQGTALHDHAGEWCVECVYQGKIKVTSYDIIGQPDDIPVRFHEEAVVYAGVGEAGALIPPFDYHIIANALPDQPSVTVHVYGHELTWCHIFEPVEGGFRRVRKDLCYSS